VCLPAPKACHHQPLDTDTFTLEPQPYLYNMPKALSLLVSFTLLCATTAHGQAHEISSTFTPMPSYDWTADYVATADRLPNPPSLATPECAVVLQQAQGKANRDSLYISTRAITSERQVIREVWTGLLFKEAQNFQLFYNGNLHLTYEILNKTSKTIDVFAQEYELPELVKIGGSKKLATVKADLTLTFPRVVKSDRTFHTSPNREFNVMYIESQKPDKEDTHVTIVMLDKHFNPLWEKSFHTLDHTEIQTFHNMIVLNDGNIFCLLKVGDPFSLKNITKSGPDHSFELYNFSENGMDAQRISLPNKKHVTCAEIAFIHDRVVLAGTFMDTGSELTSGYFVKDVDPLMDMPIELPLRTLNSTVQLNVSSALLLPRDDGGSFFTFNVTEPPRSQHSPVSVQILSISLDKMNNEEWITSIPRQTYTPTTYHNIGYISLVANNQLLVLFPDSKDNLTRYITGTEKSKNELSMPAARKLQTYISARFSSEGKVAYEIFQPLENLLFIPSHYYHKRFAGNSITFIAPGLYAFHVNFIEDAIQYNNHPSQGGLLYIYFNKP
jgi:hypothetical protein